MIDDPILPTNLHGGRPRKAAALATWVSCGPGGSATTLTGMAPLRAQPYAPSRRRGGANLGVIASIAVTLLVAGCAAIPTATSAPASEHLEVGILLGELSEQKFEDQQLTSLVAQVMIDGQVVETVEYGEAMTGFPVT